MRDINENFGYNAGKIWMALTVHGPSTENTLLKKTRLSENDFYAGVGWLARENKIRKHGFMYELKETNLTPKIGGNAGKIWNTLHSQGECDVSSIAKITQITKKDAYYALGWLARENKIKVITGKTKDQTTFGLIY
jgi:hypothetical protein